MTGGVIGHIEYETVVGSKLLPSFLCNQPGIAVPYLGHASYSDYISLCFHLQLLMLRQCDTDFHKTFVKVEGA